jgi:Carboxypeptidase regulatory-like domain
MKQLSLSFKEKAKPLTFFAVGILLLSFLSLMVMLPTNKVTAQSEKFDSRNSLNPQEWLESDEIQVPAENVHLKDSFQVGFPDEKRIPSVADPASVYATTTNTFSGNVAINGGQANTPAITRLIADDLTLVGTPPFSIGRFDFSMCNLNAVAVSARPRVRFYLNNAGTPGNVITGFSFNPITVAANNCTTLFATVAPFSVTSNQIWAGMVFDNSTATATAVQMDSFGMGLYPVPDIGTSADLIYRTTSAPAAGASFLVNNPGPGGNINFMGTPVANLGWDLRAAATVATITKLNPATRPTTGTAQWSVTTTGASLTGVTASNFTLAGTAATGSTITSVVATNLAPSSTNWTVTASIGSTPGALGLNFTGITGLNTNVTTLPFTGETYTVAAPTASTVNVSGKVTTSIGRGISRAMVSYIDNTGAVRYAMTNPQGYYRFDGIPSGATYVFTVNSKRYQFSQQSQAVYLDDDNSNLNFVALP